METKQAIKVGSMVVVAAGELSYYHVHALEMFEVVDCRLAPGGYVFNLRSPGGRWLGFVPGEDLRLAEGLGVCQ